ncbi:MAG: pirin family protein [Actinomycetota bacterium]|jgi:quercetin 2,3-dioxygenase
MSGPVEVGEGRLTTVGGIPVQRSLPQRGRRTVGAWCFVDHFGPADVPLVSMQVGPHPHIGLHTVTWVLDGEVLHRDSLGSEQLIKPGQLNLMTAGRGVAHAEESPSGATGTLHGLQLWVAQPESTRFGAPAFEHHSFLPAAEAGGVVATVLVGELAGARSPARVDSPLVGADLVVGGPGTLPLDPAFEHGLLVVDGPVSVGGLSVAPGAFAYFAPGRSELGLQPAGDGPARALLVGGAPFEEPVLMWWNFVARTKEEMVQARQDWEAASDRFGPVETELGRMPAPPPLWDRPGMQPTRK